MKLSILYRGPLASCNYGCDYCPFAKRRENRSEHRTDLLALERFLDWVEDETPHQLSIFFTPWGEALIHRRYQQAFIRLTNLPHVTKVVIQTNLSCRLDWIEHCDLSRMAVWATYHPSEVDHAKFLRQCQTLYQCGVAFSVGVVGLHEHAEAIEALRQELPSDIYLWINAFKHTPDYYTSEDIQGFEAIDPLFSLNNTHHASQGCLCHAGHTSISVDGDGTIRRCHFIREPLGTIYSDGWESGLYSRLCPNVSCGCYIGYIYLQRLALESIYGNRMLERIPLKNVWQKT